MGACGTSLNGDRLGDSFGDDSGDGLAFSLEHQILTERAGFHFKKAVKDLRRRGLGLEIWVSAACWAFHLQG